MRIPALDIRIPGVMPFLLSSAEHSALSLRPKSDLKRSNLRGVLFLSHNHGSNFDGRTIDIRGAESPPEARPYPDGILAENYVH